MDEDEPYNINREFLDENPHNLDNINEDLRRISFLQEAEPPDEQPPDEHPVLPEIRLSIEMTGAGEIQNNIESTEPHAQNNAEPEDPQVEIDGPSNQQAVTATSTNQNHTNNSQITNPKCKVITLY